MKVERNIITLALLTAALLSSAGCSRLMGGLRQDFNDGEVYTSSAEEDGAQGTTGGRWVERGWLEGEERYPGSSAQVGHTSRSPASAGESVDHPGGEQYSRNSQYSGSYFGPDEQIGPSAGRGAFNGPGPRKPQYKNGFRARRADFIDESTNEGSLWAPEGQTNYYFSKNKVRSIGDIVTITLDEQMVRDVSLEVKRTLTKQETQTELALAKQRAVDKYLGKTTEKDAPSGGAVATRGSAPVATREPAGEKLSQKEIEELPEPTYNDIDVSAAVEIKPADTIMAEIIERYPNGNYKVRGSKRVIYKNGEPRLLSVVAIAKGADIGEDDVVNSGKLYEYRLEALR